MIYNRMMEFTWNADREVGPLKLKARTIELDRFLDEFHCRKAAESWAESRGWKRPKDKIATRLADFEKKPTQP